MAKQVAQVEETVTLNLEEYSSDTLISGEIPISFEVTLNASKRRKEFDTQFKGDKDKVSKAMKEIAHKVNASITLEEVKLSELLDKAAQRVVLDIRSGLSKAPSDEALSSYLEVSDTLTVDWDMPSQSPWNNAYGKQSSKKEKLSKDISKIEDTETLENLMKQLQEEIAKRKGK